MRRRPTTFTRGQRQWRPLPTDEVRLPGYPPTPAQPTKIPAWLLIAPVSGALVMAFVMAFVYGNIIFPLAIAGASLIYPLVMVARQKQQDKQFLIDRAKIEKAYARRVEEVEAEINALRKRQAEALDFTYPTAETIRGWLESGGSRLWERRPGDSDFLDVSLGTGDVAASFSLRLPGVEIPELAPAQLLEARDRLKQLLTIPTLPITARLRELGSLAITGPRSMREGLGRSLICTLAGLHAPSDLEIYAIYAANRVEEWDWLKWLPHARALEGGAEVHLAYEPSSVRLLVSGLLDKLRAREVHPAGGDGSGAPRTALVLFLADQDLIRGEATIHYLLDKGPALGAFTILLAPNPQEVPDACAARVDVADPHKATYFPGDRSAPRPLEPSLADLGLVDKISRSLAPIRSTGGPGLEDLPDEIRLLDLLGMGDPEDVDLESRWLESLGKPPSLETPLGMRHGNRPLVVDLRQSGHGPHGLIAGTTGSGKSELLLSLLSGLALNHHPHQVNFVLVDYKGGTAMSVLQDLPHTVGVVTDLDGKQTRRALVALRSEMSRREEILTRYHVADIDKYHALGHAEPFPYLFIVIDEFAELKEHFKNDLADILREFVSVAQKGRALGVHLILAMQKPEGVVNDSIRANMKFRACLRVERAEDSRNVLGRPDAYLLPAHPPGRAYFQVGNNEQFDLFQVARVAGFHRRAGEAQEARRVTVAEVGPDGRRIPLVEVGDELPLHSEPGEVRTEAQILVEKASRVAQRMEIKRLPSPWPPPLPVSLPLGSLFSGAGLKMWDGSAWPPPRDEAGLAAPVALLDEPAHQRQAPLLLDLAQDGNLLVVGAPGSGRTTLALTVITSLALTFPPDSIHFHLIDFGGHQLQAAFSKFPHVAGAYAGSEPDRIRRLLSTLEGELEDRKERFALAGAASLAGYRRAAGDGKGLPAIVTVINNFSGFNEAFIDELSGWTQLLRGGAAYGLYFVITSDRLPITRVADLIPSRIALRLTDPTWYAVILGTRPDLSLFDPVPGRGFVSLKPPVELQVALPTKGSPERQLALLQDLGKKMSRSWKGPRPAPVRLLGDEVALGDVLPADAFEKWPANTGTVVPIGLDDMHLKPVTMDLIRRGPFILISGSPEGGKTTALASLALSLAASNHPSRLMLAVIAPNRTERFPLAPLAGLPHTLVVAQTEREVEPLFEALEARAQTLEKSPTAKQKEAIVLLIDDYHLLSNRLSQAALTRLEGIIRKGPDTSLTAVVVAPASVLAGVGDNILRQFKSARSGLWLKSTDATDALMAGLRVPASLKGKALPPGRAVLYGPSDSIVLQVASPEAKPERPGLPEGMAAWVEAVQAAAARPPKPPNQ